MTLILKIAGIFILVFFFISVFFNMVEPMFFHTVDTIKDEIYVGLNINKADYESDYALPSRNELAGNFQVIGIIVPVVCLMIIVEEAYRGKVKQREMRDLNAQNNPYLMGN